MKMIFGKRISDFLFVVGLLSLFVFVIVTIYEFRKIVLPQINDIGLHFYPVDEFLYGVYIFYFGYVILIVANLLIAFETETTSSIVKFQLFSLLIIPLVLILIKLFLFTQLQGFSIGWTVSWGDNLFIPLFYGFISSPLNFLQNRWMVGPNASMTLLQFFLIFFILIPFLIPSIRYLFEKGVFGSQPITEPMSIEESAKMIRGMLKTNNKLTIRELSELTGESETFWKSRIYTLIGDNAIAGDFDGSVYVATDEADIEALIDGLIISFEEMEKSSEGKI